MISPASITFRTSAVAIIRSGATSGAPHVVKRVSAAKLDLVSTAGIPCCYRSSVCVNILCRTNAALEIGAL